MDRRTVLAEAAIEVLAEHGSRGLTHRAVDAAAGLPQGSASNVFRTRAALLTGAVDRLAERDREALSGPAAPLRDPAELVALITRYAVALTQPPRERATRARFLLALEEQVDLGEQHQRIIATFAPVLAALGDPAPERTMRALTDYVDGAILHAFAAASRPIVPEETEAALLALLPPAVRAACEPNPGEPS